MQQLATKKTIVKKSSIEGSGIFARRNIKKGEIIFIIKGKLKKWVVKDAKSSAAGPNWIGLAKNLWLDVRTPGIFLNHSCNPSAGIKGSRQVVALRPIKVGDEITIDYSITEEDSLWFMHCQCGEKKCRKEIRSIQSLPIEVMKKYQPYTPRYFTKVYFTNKKDANR